MLSTEVATVAGRHGMYNQLTWGFNDHQPRVGLDAQATTTVVEKIKTAFSIAFSALILSRFVRQSLSWRKVAESTWKRLSTTIRNAADNPSAWLLSVRNA